MSLFLFAWVAIGLFFATLNIKFLNSTNPRMMDIIVHDMCKKFEEKEGKSADPQMMENLLIISIAFLYVVAWPIVVLFSKD